MKLCEFKGWEGVILDDRTILKCDLKLLSWEQQKALQNLEVVPTQRYGFYKEEK